MTQKIKFKIFFLSGPNQKLNSIKCNNHYIYLINQSVQVKRYNTQEEDKAGFSMAVLKEKLLTGGQDDPHSSINPISLQLYSVTNNILQYYKTKS